MTGVELFSISNTMCVVTEIHGYESAASNRRLFQAGFYSFYTQPSRKRSRFEVH